MVVAFSVLNNSQRWIELLPPQVELANSRGKKAQADTAEKRDRKVLADQVAIREFRFWRGTGAWHPRRWGGALCASRFQTIPRESATGSDHGRCRKPAAAISLPFTAPSATELEARR